MISAENLPIQCFYRCEKKKRVFLISNKKREREKKYAVRYSTNAVNDVNDSHSSAQSAESEDRARPRGDPVPHNGTSERNYISHFHRWGSPSINTQTANNSFIGRIQSRRRRRRTSESTAGSAVMELRKTDSEHPPG